MTQGPGQEQECSRNRQTGLDLSRWQPFNVIVRLSWRGKMLTDKEAQEFAQHWVAAWNSHNLDEIMSHYAADVVLVSPVAARILNDPSGTVKGREAVHAYFRRGLEAYPNLTFELIDVMWGLSSVV